MIRREDLSVSESRQALELLISGQAPIEQSSGFLVALQSKGVVCDELVGFALGMRETAITIEHSLPNLVDTCGTGGGIPSFNLSTGSAIVAASAGATIAKHGNRSVTSKCGSADVLEALGVRLSNDLGVLQNQIVHFGIAFLFAPNHHQSMKSIAGLRKNLGVRTIFNQLGPLANPANAKRQIIGVYDRSLLLPMAQALVKLGAEEAFVVHGSDGLDEISPCAETYYARVCDGEVMEGIWTPGDFELDSLPQHALHPGEGIAESASILESALRASELARALALVPNASVALYLAGIVDSVAHGSQIALETIRSGKAAKKLEEMQSDDYSR